MIFPLTPVLDSFDRANEGPPPSSNWTSDAFGFGGGEFQVVSNQMTNTSSDGNGFWNASTFGPSMEAYITLVTWVFGGNDFDLIFGYSADAEEAYGIKVLSDTSTMRLYQSVGGFQTTLIETEFPKTGANGNKIGIRKLGSRISAFWAESETTEFAEICSATDTTHTGQATIMMYSRNASAVHDNFGGGTLDESLKYVRRAQIT